MSEKSPKGSLPNGWVVKPSRHYPGKVYYFNIFTGDSTWECPELKPPRVLSDEKTEEVLVTEKTNSDMGCKNKRKNLEANNTSSTESSCSQLKTDATVKNAVAPIAIVVPVVHKDKNTTPAPENKVIKLKRPSVCLEENSSNVPKSIKLSENVSSVKKRKTVSPLSKEKRKNVSPLNKPGVPEIVPQNLKTNGKFSTIRIPVDDIDKDSSLASSSSVSEESMNDVEMRDISIDLDDLIEKKESVFDLTASYYVVVDTNVLIGQLNLVSELKDTPLDGCGPPHIFIPWVVIEELDKLKGQRNSKASQSSAEAIRYLNSVLGKHPRFHGQSPAEAEMWAKTYSKCNDDKILECCIGLCHKMPAEKVILLTNDKNLVNKARICKINVHNFESMMEKVKPDTKFNYDQTKEEKKEKEKEIKLSRIIQSVTQVEIEDKNLRSERDKCRRKIHAIMSNARMHCKEVLTEYFVTEMQEAYGDIWKKFGVDLKVLRGILEGLLRYWTALFHEFFTVKDKRDIELLLKKTKRAEGFLGDDKEECLMIISAVENLFRKVHNLRPKINVPIEQIHDYRMECVAAFMEYSEAESKFRLAEEKSIRALLDDNWHVINELCVVILNCYGVPHDFVPSECKIFSVYEIERIMVTFYPGVEQIRNLFRRILEALKGGKPIKETIKKLAKVLLEFIPSLKLHYECSSHPVFSSKALESWFSCPQNRERIERGTQQIEKFFSKLEEALLVIMRPCLSKSPEQKMMCD